jgi:enoyl-CoA hydratase/carnithine racemase
MEIERHGDVALLRLRGGKANSMNRELLERLVSLVDDVEGGDASALVITGYENFFSAGLALPSLVDLDRDAMRAFMGVFDRAMLRVFRTQIPVVAAVNGHAIAGGCVLALQCDVRIAAEGTFKIGLNEVQIGLGLPASVIEPLRIAVDGRALREIALGGALYQPADAARLGLVDEVVPAAELVERAIAKARALASGGRDAYAQIKRALRRPVLEEHERVAAAEREGWLDAWFAPGAQRFVRETVAKLTAKK